MHIWAQTRPAQISDADLRSLSAESLQLLPTSLTQTIGGGGGGQDTAGHSIASSYGSGGVDGPQGSLTRSSPNDRRVAMMAGQQALLTPQQVADHHFHQDVLRQLAEDKRQGLVLHEGHSGSGGLGGSGSGGGGGGAGGRLFDLPPDDLSLSSADSRSSLSHIEEEDDDDLSDDDDGLAQPQFDADGEPLRPSMLSRSRTASLPSQMVASASVSFNRC